MKDVSMGTAVGKVRWEDRCYSTFIYSTTIQALISLACEVLYYLNNECTKKHSIIVKYRKTKKHFPFQNTNLVTILFDM